MLQTMTYKKPDVHHCLSEIHVKHDSPFADGPDQTLETIQTRCWKASLVFPTRSSRPWGIVVQFRSSGLPHLVTYNMILPLRCSQTVMSHDSWWPYPEVKSILKPVSELKLSISSILYRVLRRHKIQAVIHGKRNPLPTSLKWLGCWASENCSNT